MAKVETLRGPIDSADMGYTLTHEHIIHVDEGLLMNFPAVFDKERIVGIARKKLTELYNAGVRTMVNAGVMGNGRNLELELEITDGLPINILECTGCFYRDSLPGFFESSSFIPFLSFISMLSTNRSAVLSASVFPWSS